jgi:hypothetical protein
MKKTQQILATIISLIILTFFVGIAQAQICEGEYFIIDDNDTSGDIAALSGCTEIWGTLYIVNTNLTSLDGLENINNIHDDLRISDNDALTSLSGLSNITNVSGSLQIEDNDALTSLSGLNNLTSVGGFLQIMFNNALTSLNGLENLNNIHWNTAKNWNLLIVGNRSLTDISTLSNITSLGGSLEIVNNDALTSLNGLENLTSGKALIIRENDILINLCALYNLNIGIYRLSIYNNTDLSMDTAYALETQLRSNGFTGTSNIHDNSGIKQFFCGPGREIYGNVSGDIQAGVNVSIYRTNCGGDILEATITTNSEGYYSFGGLEDSRYLLVVEKIGYSFSSSYWVDIPQAEIQSYDFTSLAVETVQPIMPIAICDEAVTDSLGDYNCNIGRVFNDNTDTARWTNFEGCEGGTPNANEVSQLIDCDAGANPDPIGLGSDIATTNGIISTASHRVHDCFFGDGTEPPRILEWTLPVIKCDSTPTCGVVVGTVNVDIVWITKSIDPAFYNAPTELWSADGEALLWQYADNGTSGEARWANFVEYFNLQDVEGGEPALYRGKSIYFKPSCNDVDSK